MAIGLLGNPITWIALAVAGLTAAFLYFSGTGSKALAWLGQAWNVLRSEATEAWGAIVGALAAGDLQAAFDVAMAYLQLQWVRATNFLESNWQGFRDYFLDVWSAAVKFLTDGWINAGAAMEMAWLTTLDFLFAGWQQFNSKFMSAWGKTQHRFARQFAWGMAKAYGLDSTDVLATLEEDAARRKAADALATQQALAERENVRTQRLAEIESNRKGALAENQSMFERQVAGRSAARGLAQSSEERALAKAQEKLASAINSAKLKGGTVGKDGLPAAPTSAAFQAGAQRAQSVAEAADIRTGAGLMQILNAFRGGGADAQTAKNTAHMAQKMDAVEEELGEQTDLLKQMQDDGGGVLPLADAGA